MRLLAPVAILLFLTVYILPLGLRPLVAPDETRYAEVPREMIASGDWVAPTLDGFRYFEKPVLGYWLNAASILVFGHNNFAVRFPVALCTGLSALCIFLLVRRFAGGASTGILAAMMFLTCCLVFGIGTFNVLDSLLSMLLTAAMTSFYFAFADGASKAWRPMFLVLFGIFCGLAFMAKGLLALVIPVIVIVPYVLWQRRFLELLTVCIVPLAVAVLVALPWGLAIHHRQPDFWRYFFWVEHVQRFTTPSSGQHPYPFWYFLPIILGGALPWTALAGCVYTGLRAEGSKGSLVRFSVCWLVVPFIFFSLSSGKLATYILPCFPPLMVLTIIGLQRYFAIDSTAFCKSGRNFIALLLIAAFVVVLLQFLPLPPEMAFGKHKFSPRIYLANEPMKWPLLAAALVTYAFFLWLAIRASVWQTRLLLSCLGPVLLLAAGPFLLPQRLYDGKAPGPLMERHAEGLSPSVALVTDRYSVSAVCWQYQRNDVYLIGGEGELKYGMSYPGAAKRLIEPEAFASFLAARPAGTTVLLLTPPDRYADYASILPKPTDIAEEDGFIVAHFQR